MKEEKGNSDIQFSRKSIGLSNEGTQRDGILMPEYEKRGWIISLLTDWVIICKM